MVGMGQSVNFRKRIGPKPNKNNHVQELEQRLARLEQQQLMQHAITQIIAQAAELEKAIPRIIQAICVSTGWDFGEVWHVNRETNTLNCTASWSDPSRCFPIFQSSGQVTSFAPGKGLPGRVWADGKALWMSNVVTDPLFLRGSLAERDGLRGGFGVPIRTEGEVIGVMTFFSRHVCPPNLELLHVLETIGSQIALFIERKRIEQIEREQAQQLTTLKERQRLARDLHDSVTQSLFSASVIAEMLPLLWAKRTPQQVEESLMELQSLTRGALNEMRALLIELSPCTSETSDMAHLLRHLADGQASRGKFQVALEIDDCPTLAPVVQTALFRIAQESLNNVVKYARATQVSVQVKCEPGHLSLMICDNGQGFNPSAIPPAHFGLGIMRERATEIGATFQMTSAPGNGTRVIVQYPCDTSAMFTN